MRNSTLSLMMLLWKILIGRLFHLNFMIRRGLYSGIPLLVASNLIGLMFTLRGIIKSTEDG